ncbi:MAG: IS3 family transposase [Longimicrobiales bacterium]
MVAGLPSARKRRDDELKPLVSASQARSNGTYGRPRIHEDLKEGGVRVAAKRVRRLMKELDLGGVSRRRHRSTTRRGEDARPAPDLVDRQFVAEGPCRPERQYALAGRPRFPGFRSLAPRSRPGAALVWRASSTLKLPESQPLPDGSYRSELRWNRGSRSHDRTPIPVRVIRYTLPEVADAPSTDWPPTSWSPIAHQHSSWLR